MAYSLDCTYCWYMGAEQSPCTACRYFTGCKDDKNYMWKEEMNAKKKGKVSIPRGRTRNVGRSTKG